jgi:hypothetical protein
MSLIRVNNATKSTPTAATCLPAAPIAVRQASRSDFPVILVSYGTCGEHGVTGTANVAGFFGINGQVPDGSGTLGADHAVAAQGDEDVAYLSVGQLPS